MNSRINGRTLRDTQYGVIVNAASGVSYQRIKLTDKFDLGITAGSTVIDRYRYGTIILAAGNAGVQNPREHLETMPLPLPPPLQACPLSIMSRCSSRWLSSRKLSPTIHFLSTHEYFPNTLGPSPISIRPVARNQRGVDLRPAGRGKNFDSLFRSGI